MAWAVRRNRSRFERWAAIAERRDGISWTAKGKLFTDSMPGLKAVVQQSIVRLDVFAQSGPLIARARAPFAFGWGPSFRVYGRGLKTAVASVHAQGVMATVAKRFGAQSVMLGHEEFDHCFMVKCRDAAHTALAWSPSARELMLEHLRLSTIVADGEVVEMTCPGADGDTDKLEAMMDIVGALASVNARQLLRYSELAEAESTPPTLSPQRSFTMSLGTSAGKVRVMAPRIEGQPGLVLMVGSRRELPHFSVELQSAAIQDLPPDVLSRDAHGLLPRIGDARLISDAPATLRLVWTSFPDSEAVSHGARLLEMLATQRLSQGAFR